MKYQIKPRSLKGTLSAIPSKSDAHRILICSALADQPTQVFISHLSDDIQATMDCLRALGCEIRALAKDTFQVIPLANQGIKTSLDCRESGSTLRFLLPLAAVLTKEVMVTGSGRLPSRPLQPLLHQLELHNLQFSSQLLPTTVTGQLEPGQFQLPGNVSSQYISGLLFALPLLEGNSEIVLSSELESKAYVQMTIRTLKNFQIHIEEQKNGYRIPGNQTYRSPGKVLVEGDWSNAAFFLVAGALGQGVRINGLDGASLQADRAIESLLDDFGARLSRQGTFLEVAYQSLRSLEVDVSQFPDLFPILSVLACGAKGTTRLYNAARLRLKESDRIQATATMLRQLGAEVEEFPDAMVIHGKGHLRGGQTDSFGDHRIAMACAIAAMLCDKDTLLSNPQVVNKSYPSFWQDYRELGGEWHEL